MATMYRDQMSVEQTGWPPQDETQTFRIDWLQNLDAATRLGPAARALLIEIEHADVPTLPCLGAALYRRQHAPADPTGLAITAAEWRRLWQAYRSRRPARLA